MTVVRKVKTNFTGGEIGALLAGRSNLQVYEDGVAELRDFRVMAQGGLRRRPGSTYCATLQNIVYQHESYVFNSTQSYQFLFSDARVDIFDGDGALVQTITSCAWTTAMIGALSVYSGGDYTFICHPDLPTQQLKRTGATTFVMSAFAFEVQLSGASSPTYQPYYKYADAGTTLRVEQLTGYTDAAGYAPGSTVRLTASVAMFTSAYIGLFMKVGTGQIEITGYTSTTILLGTVRTKNLRMALSENPFQCFAGSATLRLFLPFHAFTVAQNFVISMGEGFRNIPSTGINGTWAVTAVGANTLDYACGTVADAPAVGGGVAAYYWAGDFTTPDWSEPMFSVVRGYPNCGGFHQSRHVFGGGKGVPNRLNFSSVEAPFNFDVGTGLDNESIQVEIAAKRVPIIRHIVSDKHLQLFTSEGEYYAPFGLGNKPLTPGSISIFDQTNYGVTDTVRPVRFDGSTLLVTKTGKSVRELLFGNNDTGYSAPNVSFQAAQLLRTPIGLTALMEDEEQQEATAYIVNGDDGTIATFTFARKEQIAGWALWTTSGLYKTACVVDRKLFTVVRRTVNSTTKTFLEKVNHDAMLDCSVIATGTAATDWAGFSHLANQSAKVVVDSTGALDPQVVTGAGHVTLPETATRVEVGFDFIPTLLTLPPEVSMPEGPTLGQPRRVVRVILQVDTTVAASVNGKHFTLRAAGDDLTVAPTALTGLMEFWLMGWDKKGQVRISCPSPVPFTLLGLSIEIEF